MSPGGSLFRGAALEVPDDSLEAWPAASTAPFNWVRIPGEKTSLRQGRLHLRTLDPVEQIRALDPAVVALELTQIGHEPFDLRARHFGA